MMLKLVNVARSGFALYLESAGEVCPQGVPYWLTGALTGALNGPLTGALTGARCQPLQCDLPMPSFK